MLDKVFNFLVAVAGNGFIALFVAGLFYIILAIIFAFVMIPVSVLAGDRAVTSITGFIDGGIGYKAIYAIVFISMMMDDLGVPNIKTVFKKWLVRKKE